jgi:hypothetical protein
LVYKTLRAKKTPRGLSKKIKVSICLREETPNVRETRSQMDNPETLALATMTHEATFCFMFTFYSFTKVFGFSPINTHIKNSF